MGESYWPSQFAFGTGSTAATGDCSRTRQAAAGWRMPVARRRWSVGLVQGRHAGSSPSPSRWCDTGVTVGTASTAKGEAGHLPGRRQTATAAAVAARVALSDVQPIASGMSVPGSVRITIRARPGADQTIVSRWACSSRSASPAASRESDQRRMYCRVSTTSGRASRALSQASAIAVCRAFERPAIRATDSSQSNRTGPKVWRQAPMVRQEWSSVGRWVGSMVWAHRGRQCLVGDSSGCLLPLRTADLWQPSRSGPVRNPPSEETRLRGGALTTGAFGSSVKKLTGSSR